MDGIQHLPLYLPIVRFDETNWTVTGQATVEDIDAYGTIFDYEASKRAFQAWRGNVREMHDGKKAVGKAIEVQFDDEAKRVVVTTKVSRGAKDTWEKIKDGTLSGYSVGALAGKDSWTEVERNGKKIPLLSDYKLVELSLVDSPATPGCNIEIVRADGIATEQLDVTEEVAEQEEAERVEQPTDERAGARISADTQTKLHASRDTLLEACGCEECQDMMKACQAQEDGESNDDDGAMDRLVEAAIQRMLSPVVARMSGIAASLAKQHNTPIQQPTKIDTTKIEERLTAIERNATGIAEVRSALAEVKALAEKIAAQPIGGGPVLSGAALDKMLPTSGRSNGAIDDAAAIQRASQLGLINDNDSQLQAAYELIRRQQRS